MQACITGSDVGQQQRNELHRRLNYDLAGRAEVDAVCRSFGLSRPTMVQRQAAMQIIWPLKVHFSAQILLSLENSPEALAVQQYWFLAVQSRGLKR